MKLGGVTLLPADIADSFAKYFYEKVETHSKNTTVKDTVYNGKCKLVVQNTGGGLVAGDE